MTDKKRVASEGHFDDADVVYAREAAIECTQAVISFCDAAAEHDPYLRETREEVLRDCPLKYRPYIGSLFKALRVAWERIVRAWPLLGDVYPHCEFARGPCVTECRGFAEVNAWLLAHQFFWFSLKANGMQVISALAAWSSWQEEYIPDHSDSPLGDLRIWDDVHLHGRYFRDKCHEIMRALRVPPRRTAGNSILPEGAMPSPSSLLLPKTLPSG